jgi:hypothetical protein
LAATSFAFAFVSATAICRPGRRFEWPVDGECRAGGAERPQQVLPGGRHRFPGGSDLVTDVNRFTLGLDQVGRAEFAGIDEPANVGHQSLVQGQGFFQQLKLRLPVHEGRIRSLDVDGEGLFLESDLPLDTGEGRRRPLPAVRPLVPDFQFQQQ